MSSKPSQKEVAKSVKTLLVLLQSMRGRPIVINLRDDNLVEGIVEKVDGFMNIELINASIKRDTFYDVIPSADQFANTKQYDYFFVKGPRIRHIQLPDSCDDMEQIRDEIKRVRNRRSQWSKKDIIIPHPGELQDYHER